MAWPLANFVASLVDPVLTEAVARYEGEPSSSAESGPSVMGRILEGRIFASVTRLTWEYDTDGSLGALKSCLFAGA